MNIKHNKSLLAVLGVFLLGFFVFWGLAPAAKAAGGDWETVGPDEFVSTSGSGSYMALDPATNYPYVIYEDGGQNDALVVKKFTGPSWETVGNVGFSGVSYNNIAFSPTNGEPYIAFTLNSLADKVIVMRYTNSQWTVVGTTGFSPGTAQFLRLAMHPTTGEPYVAYADSTVSDKAIVQKFNGSTWETVGTAGFSPALVVDTFFAVNPNSGEPYLAFGDYPGSNGKVSVMKYDGSSWQYVGSHGFSEGNQAYYLRLAFHPETFQPYVVFEDGGINYRATVMKYNGSSWELVGSRGITDHWAVAPSIAFCPSTNEPYIAYGDSGNNYKMSVRKYDGSNWVGVGTDGFSSNENQWSSVLAFSPDTNEPYLAYDDRNSGYDIRVAVKKFNKLTASVSTLPYKKKRATKKITYTFQDLNLKAKKKQIKIWLGSKKLKTKSVKKRGYNVVVKATLKYKKMARGSYNLRMTYRGKRSGVSYSGTWRANSVLTIE